MAGQKKGYVTLPTPDTLEANSEKGQSQQVSEQAQGSNGGQTSQGGQSAQDENISKLQSKYDTKIAALTKELEGTKGLLGQYQQGYTEMQRRLDEAEVARAGSDYEKQEVLVAQSRRRIAELEGALAQKAQAEEMAGARRRAVEKLATRYGVDVDELDKATKSVTEWEDAQDIARDMRDGRKAKQQEHEEERSAANRLDLGGGKVSTTLSRYDEEIRKHGPRSAGGDGDTQALMRAQRLKAQELQAEKRK